MNWKTFARMAVPFIRAAGESKKNEDADNTGRDDMIGSSLVYAADLLDAILADKPTLPKVPKHLQ